MLSLSENSQNKGANLRGKPFESTPWSENDKPPLGIEIRHIQKQEIPVFVDMIMRILDHFEKDSLPKIDQMRKTAQIRRMRSLEDDIKRDDLEVLVAIYEGKVIGGIGVGTLHGLHLSEGIGEIRDLVVEVGFRGQGIGRQLLSHAIKMARQNRYQSIYLEVSANMTQAKRLFTLFGFRAVRTESKGATNTRHEEPAYYLLESDSEAANPKKQLTTKPSFTE